MSKEAISSSDYKGTSRCPPKKTLELKKTLEFNTMSFSRQDVTQTEAMEWEKFHYCLLQLSNSIIFNRTLCVLERTLPTELLRQLSWLGRITHTEQGRALCVLERTLPTELLRQLSWLGRITHTEQGRALCVLERTLPTEQL